VVLLACSADWRTFFTTSAASFYWKGRAAARPGTCPTPTFGTGESATVSRIWYRLCRILHITFSCLWDVLVRFVPPFSRRLYASFLLVFFFFGRARRNIALPYARTDGGFAVWGLRLRPGIHGSCGMIVLRVLFVRGSNCALDAKRFHTARCHTVYCAVRGWDAGRRYSTTVLAAPAGAARLVDSARVQFRLGVGVRAHYALGSIPQHRAAFTCRYYGDAQLVV